MPTLAEVPLVWKREGEIRARLERRSPVVFLDYDGTLTPIVEDHTKAVRSDDTRASVAALARIVERIAARHRQPRRGIGKGVLRLQPDIDWDKGPAVLWLLGRLGLDRPDVLPVHVGDDVTDVHAMQALRERRIGIVVRGEDDARETAARYALADCADVRRFLGLLTSLAGRTGA